MNRENELAKIAFEAGLKVHRFLGPGLMESAYEACLCYELKMQNLKVERQVIQPIIYYGEQIDNGYRMDLLVENSLVIELKTIEAISSVHIAQLLTYLKLGDFRLGLIFNFNVALFKNGVKRLANNLYY
jgi:GxxExxY protein